MFKADLHMHTTYSDGISTPKEMVDEAIKKRLKCICITDHDETKGATEAMRYAYDKDILVISGIELISTSGDILGINVKKIIPSGLSAKETVKQIRKAGGVAVIPHPFNRMLNGFWGGEKGLNALMPDGVEAFNATVLFGSSNKRAFAFSKKFDLPFTAGSDAHRKEFVGRGYVKIPTKILTEKDVVDAILSKQIEPCGEQLTPFEILKNGSHANVKDIINYLFLRKKNKKNYKKIIA